MFIDSQEFLKEKIELNKDFKEKLSTIKKHYLEFHIEDINKKFSDTENEYLIENMWNAGDESFEFSIYFNIYIQWFHSVIGKESNKYHFYYDIDKNNNDKIFIKDFKKFVVYNFGIIAKLTSKSGILVDGYTNPWVVQSVAAEGEYLRRRNRYLDGISLLFHNLIYNNIKLDSYDSVWIGANGFFQTEKQEGIFIETLRKILMGTVELTSESDKVLFNQGVKDFDDWYSGTDITAPSRLQNLIDFKIPNSRNFKSSMIDNYANLKLVKDYRKENSGCLSIFLPIIFLFQFFR